MRKYRCLDKVEWRYGAYKLTPIRNEDKDAIMQWRNEQMDILRQKEPLTKEKQDWYFNNVIDKLFEQERPDQLLFSFFENNILIGYGGLVHIDWESKNAEISFLTPIERSRQEKLFINDWENYLTILTTVSKASLHFKKIYTYAYGIRKNLFPILGKNGFIKEATLKEHILISNKFEDVLIHSKFL